MATCCLITLQALLVIFADIVYGDAVGTTEMEHALSRIQFEDNISFLQLQASLETRTIDAYACKILSRHEEIWERLPGGKGFKPQGRDGIIANQLPKDCRQIQVPPMLAELRQINTQRLNYTMPRLALVPYPKFVKLMEQTPFLISKSTSLVHGEEIPEDDLAVQMLRAHIAQIAMRNPEKGNGNAVFLKLDSTVEEGNEEGYQLEVSSDKVELLAPSMAGLFHGVQTLKQLTKYERAELPAVLIKDAPRFQWRGLHLDVSRHFFGAAEVKKLLNTMSAFKLNKFHWHLTDDQGWRFPVEGYPLLTEVGAESVTSRRESYSALEIKEIIKYAEERHIDILPEVDVPGHAQAAIAAYPELGNKDIPDWVPPGRPAKTWGVHHFTMGLFNDTFVALDSILSQVSKTFPFPYVHIGGDEAPTDQWSKSGKAISIVQESHAKNAQSIFTEKLGEILHNNKRQVVVWDEAQHLDGLPPDAVIMAWRSSREVQRALDSGKRVVNADSGHFYFDHYQSPDSSEPQAICCMLPLQQVYEYDPMPMGLSEDKQALVLGAQGQLWSEYFPTWRHVEYMAFPRGIALAERLWTPNDMVSSFDEFSTRLEPRLRDLDAMGVNYRGLSHA